MDTTSDAFVIDGSNDLETIFKGLNSIREVAEKARVAEIALKDRKSKAKDESIVVSDLPTSMQVEEIAAGEYFSKPYDQEKLTDLTEMNQRLKSCINTMGTCCARLGLDIQPSKNRRVADLTKEEEDRFKVQARELSLFLTNIVEDGVMFEEYVAGLIESKFSTGDGYLEVVENMKGALVGIYPVIPKYIYIKRGMNGRPDGYIQIYQGEKTYFKQFGDRRIISAKTGKEDKATPLNERATSLLHYKQRNLISKYYGVPLWTASIPSIFGCRYAEERNAAFFDNDSPLSINEKVLTPKGWVIVGSLEKGMKVIGSNGKAQTVTEILKHGTQPMYRVEFLDGATVDCTLNHTWTVSNLYDRQREITRDMTLEEIINDGVIYPSGPYKWAVPMVSPVKFESLGELPVDPYLLGLLLGDGSFRDNRVSLSTCGTDTNETQNEIVPMLPKGTTFSRRDRFRIDGKMTSRRINKSEDEISGYIASEFNFIRDNVKVSPLLVAVRELGLGNVLGDYKFIPEMYLRASINDRISLLQGLMDADGTIGDSESDSAVRYVTISNKLANDIKELVNSLGGLVSISPVKNNRCLQLIISRLPEGIIPVRLKRKVAQYKGPYGRRWRTIKSVSKIADEEARCIRVDNEDSLFVTNGYVLTHNCPRMAVLVMGGALDDITVETMKKFFRRGKGKENAGRVLVMQASAKNANNPDVKPPIIKLEPLTVGKTDDQSFGQYQKDSKDTVREAFRIASIFFGTSDDVNRAAAFTMREMTISQVFSPENRAASTFVNDTIVRKWALSKGYVTLDSNGKIKDDSKLEVQVGFKLPETMSEKDKADMFTSYASAGGLSCNDIRDILNLPRIDADWANIPQSLAVVMLQMQAITSDKIGLGNYDAVDATLDQNLTKAIGYLKFLVSKQMDPFNILSFKRKAGGGIEDIN